MVQRDLEAVSKAGFVFLSSACLAGWAEGVKGSSVLAQL